MEKSSAHRKYNEQKVLFMNFFKFFGNIVWFILCGFISGLAWLFIGLFWCITIIGIPVGIQCFKLSCVSFFPFGKNIIIGEKTSSILLNIFWIIFGGLELAIGYLIAGILLCCTIIGIPFGLQCFKLVKLSLLPFGAMIEQNV